MMSRPILLFVIGLVIGLVYVGGSFFAHYAVLQKTGDHLSDKVGEFETQKREYHENLETLRLIQEETITQINRLREFEMTYQTHYAAIQNLISRIVEAGKQHNLTFLHYQTLPVTSFKNLPGIQMYASELSLGGSFENIQTFIRALGARNEAVPIPVTKIEIRAANTASTRLIFTFSYLGGFEPLIRQYESLFQQDSQSYLVIDPWSRGI